jgi:hypothetical protein
MTPTNCEIVPGDIAILRDLFKRKRDMSQDPVMDERRRLWLAHDLGLPQRPMILAETVGVLDEVIPVNSLRCQENWARSLERNLRDILFRYVSVQDDTIIEPWIEYQWQVTIGDFGFHTELIRGDNQGKLSSYHWDPPLKDLDADFNRLHFRAIQVNREQTLAYKSLLENHFGDILPVCLRGSYWWTAGLTWDAINLIGMEPLMLAMYDNPAGLHRLMAFLRDDFLNLLDSFEREEILTLNNRGDYIGSGSVGYTNELPAQNKEGFIVRAADMWGLSESQETVGVSPSMFEEFIFPYQEAVAKRFGRLYYGCCEPVHKRIHIIKRLPNLRRVSVSPWADQEKMADALGKDYVFCRKPNPTQISTEVFDEEQIRADIRETLRTAGGCALELVMKDVHTLCDRPDRLGRWVSIARQECQSLS